MWRLKRNQRKPKKRAPRTPQQQLVRRQIIIGLLLVLIIAAVLSAIAYVTRLPALQVQGIAAVGGVTISHERIEDIAAAELSGTYFRLIPKGFVWLYPKDAIVREIQRIDRVKNVHVARQEDDVLAIAFEEYRPIGLWCSSVDSADCFFIDATGLAFARAPELTGAAFVRYVTQEEPTVGATITSKDFLDETAAFISRMEAELGLFVTHVVTFADEDVEYYLSGGGQIKVAQDMPAAKSFNNLKTILASEAFAHLEPGEFQYIDLRFGDKVFVNEVTESVTGTTTATSTATSSALTE